MPNRIVREGIISSEAVNSLGWDEEVFYRRLHSVVDDYGRFHANPSLLRAACYPLQLDKVGNQDVAKWLTACVRAGLVRAYTVEGKQYLEVVKFGQHVRAKESKFPHPPDACNADVVQMHRKRTASAPVVVDECEGGTARRSRRSPKVPIPPAFAISERVRTWAAERGIGNLEAHFEHFVGKAKAKGYTYADWDEGLMGAIRDDWAKLGDGSITEKNPFKAGPGKAVM